MPRILRIANRFNLGGPTFNVAYLTKYLPDNYETLLIGGDKEENEASSSHILQDLGIRPVIIPELKREISLGVDMAAYRAIEKIIDDFKPDIVHTHASKPGAIGRLAAHNRKVPVIVHTFHGHYFHSYFGRLKTNMFKQIERSLAKRTSKIIAISDIQKHELSVEHKIAPPDKFEVIPLGFDLDRFRTNTNEKRKEFRTEFNVKDDEVAIGIIGRLVDVKDHRYFLRLVRHVLDETTKKVRFFIVGDGEMRTELEDFCRELEIPFNAFPKYEPKEAPLTFCSWRTDIDRINAGLDIVVLTSKNEGTPVSLIEAQASGTPVVSTNVGGVENVVEHGITGLLAEPTDELKMAENLMKLIESDELRNDMAVNGWSHVGERFHYSRLTSDMDRLYQHLLDQNQGFRSTI
ncbi:MAG: glycosyltransferase [Flavobacteriales bacterium]|nr:glycosyltransferase [Flavobacteriales bacterium]